MAQYNPDGSVVYLHHDQLGSTRLVTSTSGVTVGSYTYDAYGVVTDHSGAVGTPLGYGGQYHDTETGFLHLRARFYDPATGQFLTRDPIETLTREPYAYTGGSPLNRTDPMGLEWWDPRDWDQDVINIGKDVGGRAVDVGVAVVNAPVTAGTAAANSWSGGDCDWEAHLTVVCYGGVVSEIGLSDTWTTGNTINTTRDSISPELLRHETWHTRQWAIFGPVGMPLLYGANSALSELFTGGQCWNVFEWWAGFDDGGYDCSGFGREC